MGGKSSQWMPESYDIFEFLEVRFKKLHEKAVTPTYARSGDAGLDLTAATMEFSKTESRKLITYGTGIAIEIPMGYYGLVLPRSSIRKTDLRLTNSVGLIDSE